MMNSRGLWQLRIYAFACFLHVGCSNIHSHQNLPANFTQSTEQRLHVPNSTVLEAETIPDAKRCWEAIKHAYENETVGSSSSSSFTHMIGDCSKCCNAIKVKSKVQDWIRIIPCGPLTVECLMGYTELQGRVTENFFWLSSTGKDILVYMGNSSEVVITWDYLSMGQKVLEMIFYWLILVTVIITLFGNGLVIATMVGCSNRHNPWWMVRTSLAVTDLLRGSFVMTFALYITACLMNKYFPFSILEKSSQSTWFEGDAYQHLLTRNGYGTFCRFLSGVTEIMALQCQAWLALERLLMCKYCRKSSLLSSRTVKSASCIMWLIGIAFPLIILYGGNDSDGNVFFDPMTKLPLLFPIGTLTGTRYVAYVSLMTYFLCLFLFTVIASVNSIVVFNKKSREEMAEAIRFSPSARVKQQKKVDHHILSTMKLMIILYVISVAPRFFVMLPGLKETARFFYVTCWWLFIQSSTWNWYVFNLRSHFFIDSLSKLLLRLPWLPSVLQKRLETLLLPASASNLEWGSLWRELEAEIEKKKIQAKQEELV